MKNFLCFLFIFILSSCSMMSTKSEDFEYEVDGQKHVGHIVSGVKKGEKRPAVIVVHEWWGHNDYARKRADMLAKEGYVAISIDMFGEGKTANHPSEAGEFAKMAMSDFPLAQKRFEKALEILKAREDVDQNKIAAIGYCFGGGVVLNMARAGVPLNLVASFHGGIVGKNKAQKGKFSSKVLVFNGAADPMVTAEHITSFKKEMDDAKVNYSFVNYQGAKHAFTNKQADEYGKKFSLPLAYDQKADQDSWEKFLAELKKI